jgi:hypothetical protein
MQIAAKKNAGAKRPAVFSQRARFRDAIYRNWLKTSDSQRE